MKDSHGRTIDYLRISLTDRCNFRCIYCMPEEGVQSLAHEDILRIEEIEEAVRVAAGMGIRSIRLTGGEPLVRLGVVDLVRAIAHTPGIENVSMTTNGVLLPKMAVDLKEAGLSRVNISLDTLDPAQFRQITRRGELQQTLDGIDAALAAGFNPVKINAVAVRSLDQDYLAFAKLSIDRPLHVRFIEYMPVGESSGSHGCGWGKDDVVPSEELFEIINERARAAGMDELVPAGNDRPLGWGPARYFEFPNAQGTVGFISPLSRHFCSECNRLRLTADGKLRPCLFSDDEYDVRTALRAGDDQAVRAVFAEALGAKPDEHHDKVGTERANRRLRGSACLRQAEPADAAKGRGTPPSRDSEESRTEVRFILGIPRIRRTSALLADSLRQPAIFQPARYRTKEIPMTDQQLTHIDEQGAVRMVDVSQKADTERVAVAEGFIAMHPETLALIVEGKAAKGDVLACARVAGVMAAKQTSSLIPMCHPLNITKAKVECAPVAEGERPDGLVGIHVTTTCGVTGKTGIEMEALTAASVACLTVYDMCKAVDRGMEIMDVRLLKKEGGKSGLWEHAF